MFQCGHVSGQMFVLRSAGKLGPRHIFTHWTLDGLVQSCIELQDYDAAFKYCSRSLLFYEYVYSGVLLVCAVHVWVHFLAESHLCMLYVGVHGSRPWMPKVGYTSGMPPWRLRRGSHRRIVHPVPRTGGCSGKQVIILPVPPCNLVHVAQFHQCQAFSAPEDTLCHLAKAKGATCQIAVFHLPNKPAHPHPGFPPPKVSRCVHPEVPPDILAPLSRSPCHTDVRNGSIRGGRSVQI